MTIKEFRNEYKLSQSALAKAVGVNESVIGHIEHGRMKLSGNIAAKIYEIYGIMLDMPETGGPAAKTLAPKVKYADEIVIQSPLGGEITPEQIVAKLPEQVRAKIPEGAECVFVRVDQNKLWWIRGEETGNVEIWD